MSKDDFFKRSTLGKGVDFNTIKQSGFYNVASSEVGGLINFPSNNYGYGLLLVYNIGPIILQLYFPDLIVNKPVIYRTSYGDDWRNWNPIAPSSNMTFDEGNS